MRSRASRALERAACLQTHCPQRPHAAAPARHRCVRKMPHAHAETERVSQGEQPQLSDIGSVREVSVSTGRLTLEILQFCRLGTCHPAVGTSTVIKQQSF